MERWSDLTKTNKPRGKTGLTTNGEIHGLIQLAVRACMVASDAAFNTRDFLATSAQMAYLAVRDCEKELDRIEQQMDQRLPSAITQVTELEARELLACHRFSTELERIGDLLWWVTQRAQNLTRVSKADSQLLVGMVGVLQTMLLQLREGFTQRDLGPAGDVLRADREIDQAYKSLFRRHLLSESNGKMNNRADVFLMAQALERAGDHATNLAEELFRLVEGQSLRHLPKKRVKD